ncbi:hypothetical protein RKD18_005410 [Streptomyces phaeoluteigriseus]
MVSGVESTDSAVWMSLSLRQRTPSLAPTPRGSQLTRSYCLRKEETVEPYAGIVDTPEPPGPPKLNSSEPVRLLPVARDLARIIARSIVSPSGFDQSSGTFSSAHCQSPPGASESAVALQRPQAGFCPVSEAGRGAAVTSPVPGEEADGRASAVRPLSSSPSSDEPPQPVINSAATAPDAANRANRAMCAFPPSRDRPHRRRTAVRP